MDLFIDDSFEGVLFSLPTPAVESVLRILEQIENYPTMSSLMKSLDGDLEAATAEGFTFLIRDNFQAVLGCLKVSLDDDGDIHAEITLFS
ncbi:hypothetical protein HRH59_09990 [Rheinheimera sp. YQF-2]|uniref:Uncharacterized protein n=1 Tax=Rheinheimera lutimaris TaxID=2740584 RepID=A0A7Y5AQW2_9GAMM|nr:hypothetical protein [Rheinheimera lutimaris]NRQ42882.1 hypothetical protein [Rheinheimera lutimaris]